MPQKTWRLFIASLGVRGEAVKQVQDAKSLPYLSKTQMLEVDRAMVEDFKIGLIQMMENAGRHLAQLARERFLRGDAHGRDVTVLAGSGGNGGGALVAARRLAGWGGNVQVVLSRPPEHFKGVPAHQLHIIREMRLPILDSGDLPDKRELNLVIDGLIGYRLQGFPRGMAADLIMWANSQDAPILALDIPSGLDPDVGIVHEPVIRAAATLSLALPKKGLRGPGAQKRVGELYLGDISVPPSLYRTPSLNLAIPSVFALEEIVRIK